MLATTLTNNKHSSDLGRKPRWNTYIPSPFVLLMALDNGWKVAGIELAPLEDQFGLVYLVTLRSESLQPDQKLVLPATILVQKILAEHSQKAIPVEVALLV